MDYLVYSTHNGDDATLGAMFLDEGEAVRYAKDYFRPQDVAVRSLEHLPSWQRREIRENAINCMVRWKWSELPGREVPISEPDIVPQEVAVS